MNEVPVVTGIRTDVGPVAIVGLDTAVTVPSSERFVLVKYQLPAEPTGVNLNLITVPGAIFCRSVTEDSGVLPGVPVVPVVEVVVHEPTYT